MKKKEYISHKTELVIRTAFLGLVIMCNMLCLFPKNAILDCLVTANIIWIISDYWNRARNK